MEEKGSNLYRVLWHYNLLPENGSKIVCPFHADENPSLLLNFEEGTWYCFGCQKRGDAAAFVKYMNPGYNDLMAYKKMLKIIRSDKQECIVPKGVIIRKRKSKSLSYVIAYDYYHGLKSQNWKSDSNSVDEREYLGIKKYMIGRGFTPDVLNKVKAKLTYNVSYPIIFPMLDNGKFKGWVCRATSKAIEAKRKYLYNEGFSRRDTLVGEYGKKDYVFVVEGFMDRLKFLQYGEENVVAILGWKMSKEQEQKLKKAGIVHVISALDNDEAGKRGTRYLSTIFQTTRFCYLKGIKDPGEMTEEKFRKMYNKTMKIFNDERRKHGTVRQH